MEKIAINPNRLQWCMEAMGVNFDDLSLNLNITKKTLEKAMERQAALSVNQLEKIANYFKRSLLFFLDPNDPREEKIYSPQFRTINNQKPINSVKLRAFIERVEKQREVYMGLMEDLEEPLNEDWHPNIKWNANNIKVASAKVRQWLGFFSEDNKFDNMRQAIERKGIMVIVSNGYNGKWQIDKSDPIRGFSLFYNVLPIIVIKKEQSEGAQAFTLMHELAHLILHKESMIDEEEDFYSYQDKEKEANEFAGNLLIPDNFLKELNINKLLNLKVEEYDSYLSEYKKNWCVSGEVILRRLLNNDLISKQEYETYRDFKKKKQKDIEKETSIIPRAYRHREPLNVFGKPYVYAVFDSLHNRKITLAKASTFLDNLKISDVRELERYV